MLERWEVTQSRYLNNGALSELEHGKGRHTSCFVADTPVGPELKRCKRWHSFVAALTLFGTALAQTVLASIVRRKAIRLDGHFFGDDNYPTAGDAIFGYLSLSIAVCLVTMSVLDETRFKWRAGGVRTVVLSLYAAAVVGFNSFRTFAQQSVYQELSSYDQCADDADSDDDVEGIDCICWSGQPSGECNDCRGSVDVYIASGGDIACDTILDNVDDILASYILMVVTVLLIVAGVAVQICGCTRTSATPSKTAPAAAVAASFGAAAAEEIPAVGPRSAWKWRTAAPRPRALELPRREDEP